MKIKILNNLHYASITTLVILMLICILFNSCESNSENKKHSAQTAIENSPVKIIVLGNVQDGGSPHIGCQKKCCADLFEKNDKSRMVVSLGVIDFKSNKTFLFEASPDISRQISALQNEANNTSNKTPDGIFITHAHIGHYTGLMYLGREALGGQSVPVYVMPRMQSFLSNNGPWNQLIKLKNIQLNPLQDNQSISLTQDFHVTPFVVPHRDEYSETVGFIIKGYQKSALFIPDINKWHIWNQKIVEEIKKVDFAFLDGTFYNQDEIPHRNMSEIPHPFVEESMKLFSDLSSTEKNKIYFIHLNHSNPLLNEHSKESRAVEAAGFHVARTGQQFDL